MELQGQQSKIADKIETESFFTVKHMRLIERVMGICKVVGRIGGPDRLIHKLNANSPNEELEKLLECVGFIISYRLLYSGLPCRVTGGGNDGKEKWEKQDEMKASPPLPAL